MTGFGPDDMALQMAMVRFGLRGRMSLPEVARVLGWCRAAAGGAEAPGVNLPGVLYLGDLAATARVTVGTAESIVVDNTTTPASVSLAIGGSFPIGSLPSGSTAAPALSFQGDAGTGVYRPAAGATALSVRGAQGLSASSTGIATAQPLALNGNSASCAGLASAGAVSCGTSALACGALSSGAVVAAGTVSCGANTLACGALSSGAIAATGTVSCTGTLSCGALNPPAVAATGPVSCGANAATCGALSCASVASAGAVTQPRYYLRLSKGGAQNTATSTITAVSWNTADSNSGFTFTANSTTVTIPVAGLYAVSYGVVWGGGATGYREHWVEVGGGTLGTTRRYADTLLSGAGNSLSNGVAACGSFIYNFATIDGTSNTFQLGVFQNFGGVLKLIGTGALPLGIESCFVHVERLSG